MSSDIKKELLSVLLEKVEDVRDKIEQKEEKLNDKEIIIKKYIDTKDEDEKKQIFKFMLIEMLKERKINKHLLDDELNEMQDHLKNAMLGGKRKRNRNRNKTKKLKANKNKTLKKHKGIVKRTKHKKTKINNKKL
jgi:hypothetical protein